VTNIDPHQGKKGGPAAKKPQPHQVSKYDEEDENDESEQAMRGNPNGKMQNSPAPNKAKQQKQQQPPQ